MAAQFILPHDLVGGGLATSRLGEPERLVEQGQCLQPAVGHRQRHQRGIEPVRAQSFQKGRGQILAQSQPQLWVVFPQRRHEPWQDVGTERRDDAEAETAGQGPGNGLADADDGVDFLHHLTGAPDDLLADGGDTHRLGRALEQLDAKPQLEVLDLRAEGRLRDSAGSGGAAEVTVLSQSDDVTQVL